MSVPSVTTPLAALTTIFTPPCATSWLLSTTKAPSQYPPFPTTGPASCDPPSWTANLSGRGFQFYSPAICPSGFYVGPGCQITVAKTAQGFPAIQAGETAAFCVPSGQSCTSDTTDFRGGVWGATANDDEDDSFTVGPALQIRFQASDLASLETHPLTPGRTLSSVTATAVSVTAGSSIALTSKVASPSGFTTIATSTSLPALTVATSTSELTAVTAASTSSVEVLLTTEASLQTTTSPQSPNPITSGKGIANGDSLDAGLVAVIASVLTFTFAICVLIIFRIRGFPQVRSFTLPWKKPKGLVSVGLGAWIGRRADDEEQPPSTSPHNHDGIDTSAQADTEMALPAVVVEAEKPLGSTENPAELDGDETQRLSQRASWVSRLLSRVARSSIGTRSSSQSRWTQRSLARSGGWEPFPEEAKGGGGGGEREGEEGFFDHDALAVPRLAHVAARPRTMSSSSPDEAAHEGPPAGPRLSAPAAITRFRSFDRLSTGTFGAVVVRGRSPGSRHTSHSLGRKE